MFPHQVKTILKPSGTSLGLLKLPLQIRVMYLKRMDKSPPHLTSVLLITFKFTIIPCYGVPLNGDCPKCYKFKSELVKQLLILLDAYL